MASTTPQRNSARFRARVKLRACITVRWPSEQKWARLPYGTLPSFARELMGGRVGSAGAALQVCRVSETFLCSIPTPTHPVRALAPGSCVPLSAPADSVLHGSGSEPQCAVESPHLLSRQCWMRILGARKNIPASRRTASVHTCSSTATVATVRRAAASVRRVPALDRRRRTQSAGSGAGNGSGK